MGFYEDMLDLFAVIERANTEAALLAGDRDLSDDEAEIVFDCTLTFQDKLANLAVLRGEATKPKSFKKLTKTDKCHAQALGIRL